jgi:cytochrome P450
MKVQGPALWLCIGALRRSYVLEYERICRRHGDLVWLGWPLRSYLAVHPGAVEQVLKSKNYVKSRTYRDLQVILGNGLVTAEGDTWRQNRRLVAPLFTPRHVMAYRAPIEAAMTRWLDALPAGRVRMDDRIVAGVYEMALAVLFGAHEHAHAAAVGHHVEAFMEYYLARSYGLLPVPRWSRRARLARRSVAALDAELHALIDAARQRGSGEDNVLQRLLTAHEAVADASPLDHRQLRDELVTLWLAGHETTASAFTWICYLLAQHPRTQHALREACAADEPPELCAFILEAMRLYPPVPGLSRQALAADSLQGQDIPAGARVELSQWVTHRHPAFWEDANALRPERFLGGADPGFAYFPFGGGPRVCIGDSLATRQLQWMTQLLLKHCQLARVLGDVTPRAGVTLRPWPALHVEVLL